MGLWRLPDGMVGNVDHIRVFASHVRTRKCAQFAAVKARPQVYPRIPDARRRPVMEEFPLGRLMDVLDRVEFEGLAAEQAVALVEADPKQAMIHDGVDRWLRSAVGCYLEATAAATASQPTPELTPQRDMWVVQAHVSGPAPVMYEVCAWGRRYESVDGTSRELQIPSSSWPMRERPLAETAVAAYVAAFGNRVPDGYSSAPYLLGDASAVTRVRVVQVSCTMPTVCVLFDGTAEDAADLYRRHAREPLRQAVDGGPYVPGSDCLKCKMITVCPALPRTPRLLPRPAQPDTMLAPRRLWSATTGRDYQGCPTREYLRRVRLPRDPAMEYSDTAVRGNAVHAWLNAAHERDPLRACTPADLPEDPERWSAGQWTIAGEQARVGRAALQWHVGICPLAHLPAGVPVFAERQVVAFDAASNTLIAGTPDLLYQDGPGWVWREVKTTQGRYFPDGVDLLRRYPQLAIAVGLLWAGALPGDASAARIEVEQLSPHAGPVEILVPADPQVRAVAREVVADLVADWYGDTRAAAKPGENCRTCEVSLWCPSALVPLAADVVDRVDETEEVGKLC